LGTIGGDPKNYRISRGWQIPDRPDQIFEQKYCLVTQEPQDQSKK